MLAMLDMDGVVANFVGGAAKIHHRPYPYTFGDPKSMGIFELETIWHMTPQEFWEPIRAHPDFWYTLEEMPDGRGIVEAAVATFGQKDCCFLTAPDFKDPHGVVGKHYWIETHYPAFKDNVIFGKAKQFLAGPDRCLIDDRDKNIKDFKKFGGVGIRVPRLWNQEWEESTHSLEIVKERINDAASIPEGSTQVGPGREG